MEIENIKSVLRYCDGNLFWIKTGKVAGHKAKDGYTRITIFSKKYLAHRVVFAIFNNRFPKIIDHINGNRSDNRIENLRECDRSINSYNKRLQKNNKSGFVGVFFHKQTKTWKAYIRKNGKTYALGYFHNIEDAIIARINAEWLIFGEQPLSSILSTTNMGDFH